MEYSICSYSFHHLLEAGKQDMFGYIQDCKKLGTTYLDPWSKHLVILDQEDGVLHNSGSADATFSPEAKRYAQQVKDAADEAGIPFGCLCPDRTHIYEATPEQRAANRSSAYRWLDVAAQMGFKQISLSAGGTGELTDEILDIIVQGYHDLISRGRDLGVEVIMENHWGLTLVPENVVRILDAVGGLGMLFDTGNWVPGSHQRAYEMCIPYARLVHIKAYAFDEHGNDPDVDNKSAVNLLLESGYAGVWGLEPEPRDADEYGAARKTIELITRLVEKRVE